MEKLVGCVCAPLPCLRSDQYRIGDRSARNLAFQRRIPGAVFGAGDEHLLGELNQPPASPAPPYRGNTELVLRAHDHGSANDTPAAWTWSRTRHGETVVNKWMAFQSECSSEVLHGESTSSSRLLTTTT